MRTIKFRVWDVRHGQMIKNAVVLSKMPQLVTVDTQYFNSPFTLLDECNWMQFIGLKDKNGKEIYEDDYIKFYEDEKDAWIFQVVYIEPKACFALESPSRYMDFMAANFSAMLTETHSDKFEVIGDIYRNPEIKEILGSI